jgi:NAD(P)-dependent dehydrogenase (short-subunit alcohol dehydrogenase family)
MPRQPFNGRVAIVTGGASGIGRALCETLARRGAEVVVADIDLENAQTVAQAICAADGRARAVPVDVTQAAAVQRLVRDTAAAHGRVDYMFNNAARSVAHNELGDVPSADWQQLIDVNLFGVVNGTVAAYEVMLRQGYGHIVNTASLAGLIGFPTHAPYALTKGALVALSTSLWMEAADRGVRVSVVCPGHVRERNSDGRRPIGAQRAAHTILRGVARHRHLIVFPLHARILWALYRISPWLVYPLGRRVVRDFRTRRRDLQQP